MAELATRNVVEAFTLPEGFLNHVRTNRQGIQFTMATEEEIRVTTDSSAVELAPAVLIVLEKAGTAGLGSGSRTSPIADAVCERFQVVRSSPIARGSP